MNRYMFTIKKGGYKLQNERKEIRIVTDSTIDIPKHLLDEWNVEVVPLTTLIEGETFFDGINITPIEFMKRMKDSKELPKSSQPAAGQFLEVYNKLDEEGFEILSLHVTSGLSGTVNSARTAAEMSDAKITVVDTRLVSWAMSFQVLEAAKMAKEGKTIKEILARLDVIRDNTHLYLILDTMENLAKGGRIGRGKALLGSLLNIKPIASLADGVYTPVAKPRGYAQVVKQLTKFFIEDTKGKTIKGIGFAEADGMWLATAIKEAFENTRNDVPEISIIATAPAISVHTGPGAVAVMYFAE